MCVCVCVEIEMILEVVLGFILLCSKLPPIKKARPGCCKQLDRSCAAAPSCGGGSSSRSSNSGRQIDTYLEEEVEWIAELLKFGGS